MTPGTITTDIGIDDYHRGPGVSKSGLDLIERSPLHYWWSYLRAGDRQESGDSESRVVGSGLHALVLEGPQAFRDRFAIMPQFGRRKQDVADKEQWERDNAGKTWLRQTASRDDAASIKAMRDALSQHREASKWLGAPGRAEVSAYWTDEATGILCRCRADKLLDAGIVVDLKSTRDASDEAMARSIDKWRYHVQHAFYTDGLRQLGVDVRGFVFVFVESAPPHGVRVIRLDAATVEIGRGAYRRNLDTYARCIKSGEWPGYSDAIDTIGLPAYRLAQHGDDA